MTGDSHNGRTGTQGRPATAADRRRRLGVLVGFAGLVLLAAVSALPAGVRLDLTPVGGRAPLVTLWLDSGERFTIRYNHSVEEAPIWETHSVDQEGRIYIEEERYLKFGAGMGKMPGVGHMVRRGPYEVIEDMHYPTGDFILRIGSPGVDHTLICRGQEIHLSALAPHMAVKFSARPVNRLERIMSGWLLNLFSTNR